MVQPKRNAPLYGLGDLEKLRLLFDMLPDEELLDALDRERAEGGRRDWSN